MSLIDFLGVQIFTRTYLHNIQDTISAYHHHTSNMDNFSLPDTVVVHSFKVPARPQISSSSKLDEYEALLIHNTETLGHML